MRGRDTGEQWLGMVYIVFISIAVTGGLLFYFTGYGYLGGLGAGAAGMAIPGFLYCRMNHTTPVNTIESPSLYFLLVPVVAGVLLIIYNDAHGQSEFINGVASAICIVGAMIFSLEILRRFSRLI